MNSLNLFGMIAPFRKSDQMYLYITLVQSNAVHFKITFNLYISFNWMEKFDRAKSINIKNINNRVVKSPPGNNRD
jgi:hypothetical protein